MLVVAASESCGNDAVKILLDCSKEAGNLVIQRGQQPSWSFYNFEEEEGVSLIINPVIGKKISSDRSQAMQELASLPHHVLFIVEPFKPDQC